MRDRRTLVIQVSTPMWRGKAYSEDCAWIWSDSRTLRFPYSKKEQTGKYSIVEGHTLKSISGNAHGEAGEALDLLLFETFF